MSLRLYSADPPACERHAPAARLYLVRAERDAGTGPILALCRAYGLPEQAANLAGRGDDSLIIAIEVPADVGAGAGMLEAELRALPGVRSVTVTPVGVSARAAAGPNLVHEVPA